MKLDRLNFGFTELFGKAFLYSGPAEKPTEKRDITGNLFEIVIGLFLKKPGLIVAPDGSEFVLTLALTPAAAAAKKQMLAEAQQHVTESNTIELVKGTADWTKHLTEADRVFFERISAARVAGTRITYRLSRPDQFTVVLTEPHGGRFKSRAVITSVQATATAQDEHDRLASDFAKGGDGAALTPFFEPSWDAAPIGPYVAPPERIAVVVLTVPKSNSETFVVERTAWDEQMKGTYGTDWLECTLAKFCKEYNLDRDDITNVDFEQTRTRQEINNLPDFNY